VELERPESIANHSPSTVEVKNTFRCNYTLQQVFMAWYLIKYRENLPYFGCWRSNFFSFIYIYGSTALCWTFAAFFSVLILYTVGRTAWKGDQPVTVAAHELSSVARKLGAWVLILLKAWVSVLCAFILFVLFCV
jgi:hypothetical protein